LLLGTPFTQPGDFAGVLREAVGVPISTKSENMDCATLAGVKSF
jgi:hypothetical protein